MSDLRHLFIQRLLRNAPVDQAQLQGAPSLEPLPGEKKLPRRALADPPDDVRADGRRDEADLDLAQPEPGLLRGDDDITGREKAGAAADDRPADAGAGGLGQRMDR